MNALAALARRAPPRHPGPARLGQDVDVGPADRAPARARQARRRRLDEPQGDPQAARRGRGGRGRARARLPRAEEGERRQPRVGVRGRRTIENVDDNADAASTATLARRHGLALLRRRPRRRARLPLRRRGRPGLARRRARDGRRARATSSSSATRSSSPRCSRARTRPAAARRCSSTCSASDATIPPDRGLFLERTFRLHPDVCGYISEEFYEGRLAARRRSRATRTTPLGTGLRYLAGRARGQPAGVAARRSRRCAPRSRGCVAAGVRAERDHGRRAVQRAGERCCASALPAGVARRHGGQVPGPGGRRRLLLDGELERRGRPARPRVPALAQPAQRRDLARAVPRLPRLLARGCSRSTAGRSRRCGSRTRSAASSSWRNDRAACRVGVDLVEPLAAPGAS